MDHLLPVQLVELQSIATDLAENRIAPLAAEVDAECRWPCLLYTSDAADE